MIYEELFDFEILEVQPWRGHTGNGSADKDQNNRDIIPGMYYMEAWTQGGSSGDGCWRLIGGPYTCLKICETFIDLSGLERVKKVH